MRLSQITGLGTRNFYFQDRKKIEISGHFSGHQKKRVFLSFRAHITSEHRAQAKITIRRHEVVYRLSSERKMIDLTYSKVK